MSEQLSELKRRLAEIHDLGIAARVLEWDQLVMMPRGGAASRADHLATVTRVAHEKLTSDALGALLDDLLPLEESLDPESDDACLIRVARRDWEKATRVPAELQAEITKLASESVEAWAAAREADDYAAFRPWLDRTLEVKARYAACFEPGEDPYDVFLDDFEEGMRTSEARRVLDALKPELRALAAEAADDEDEPFTRGPFPRAAQHELSLAVARAFGCTDESFRLDGTVHPFCISFSTTDVRLTTRYAEDDLYGSSLFSTMHEAGHGLYEHGVDRSLERTPLGTGCSSALHESQSRLWENVIGRSAAFWRWFYPQAQSAFPEALGGVPLDRFHRAINRVRRSFIRVDADETTYGLHIILRFELEQELLSGRLSTADLPDAWNARFEEYLGVPVPDDRTGCLQDTHWAAGLFGYFPTYQLGNVLSVQIWERLRAEVGDTDALIERGDFGPIHAWLRDSLYALGRKHTPAETIERVAGGPIDPEPYLRYLRAKQRAH